MTDAEGRLYNGDELLYVVVRDGVEQGKRSGVVGTLMTNLAIENALKELGVSFARAKVGDRYVLEMLVANGWLWGGESSGHLLCLDKHTTGDGTISALQVFAALKRNNTSLADYTRELKMFPQILVNVRTPSKADWTTKPDVVAAVAAAEKALSGRGRVLLRASGTEPVIRVMVEGEDRAEIDGLANAIADLLRAAV